VRELTIFQIRSGNTQKLPISLLRKTDTYSTPHQRQKEDSLLSILTQRRKRERKNEGEKERGHHCGESYWVWLSVSSLNQSGLIRYVLELADRELPNGPDGEMMLRETCPHEVLRVVS